MSRQRKAKKISKTIDSIIFFLKSALFCILMPKMQYEEAKWYSDRLGREMMVRVYGHYGTPVIAFPCQDQPSDDFANHGMIDALSPLIETGRMKLFCVDSNDPDTVSYQGWDQGKAAYMLEQYHRFVIDELLPFVYAKQGGHCLPFLVGASMGGSHASNHFFRRPDLFSGFLALSACFDIARFFNGYVDENVYNNSPVHYLANMPTDHPYISLYSQRKMIAVVGDGAWEHLVRYSYPWLESIAKEKGIRIEFNYWDENSVHDWPSWLYQMPFFLDETLE